MIRAGLEAKDKSEEILHESLDAQESLRGEMHLQKQDHERLISDQELVWEQTLELVREQTEKLKEDLERELAKEKKKWRCAIQ